MMISSCGDVAEHRARFSGASVGLRFFEKLLQSASIDFCPSANRYVYWLKEPIGWFVMALVVSVLVGMHVTPVGWTLASVIGSILAVGVLWPWVAVRIVRGGLKPVLDEVHEGQACELVLSIRNSLPLPLWGLAIQGYLDREGDDAQPTTALSCVPGLSHADYRLPVCPTLRGRYPVVKPTITCAFPFGIWTARRPLDDCAPLTVLPQVHSIQGDGELSGGRLADWGDGLRPGTSGELLGVREFRGGDRLRNVHWVHTARTGNLMVCERSGPEQQHVDVHVDLRPMRSTHAMRGISNRDAVAWRIRTAASLVAHLHARRFQVTLHVGNQATATAGAAGCLRQMLLALAEVPTEGVEPSADESLSEQPSVFSKRSESTASNDRARVMISSIHNGPMVQVELIQANQRGRSRSRGSHQAVALIDLQQDVACQFKRFWREVDRAHLAA